VNKIAIAGLFTILLRRKNCQNRRQNGEFFSCDVKFPD